MSATFAEIHCLYVDEKRVLAKEDWIREARWATYAQLIRLKKVCKKVYLKEFCLVKQGLYKLESEERGSSLKDLETVLYSPVVGSLIAPRLPLVNSFFNPFFPLLPNLISFNMP